MRNEKLSTVLLTLARVRRFRKWRISAKEKSRGLQARLFSKRRRRELQFIALTLKSILQTVELYLTPSHCQVAANPTPGKR
jgi:hypothetical protein